MARAEGITLRLRFPNGKVEAVSASASDAGARVLGMLAPLRALHRVPAEALVLRVADGAPLEADRGLREQGLRNGSSLVVRVPAEDPPARRSAEDERVVLGREELEAQQADEASVADLAPEEREARASHLKGEANEALKSGDVAKACELYTVAIALLSAADCDAQLAAALFNNRALAHLRLGAHRAAREDAERALRLQPDSAKASYRLGAAARALGDLAAAGAAFRAALALEPRDAAARAALAAVDAELRRARETPAEEEEGEAQAAAPPPALRRRLERLQQGYALPQYADAWRQADARGAAGQLGAGSSAGLRRLLRARPPVEAFFRAGLAAAAGDCGPGALAVVVGAGCCVAAPACADLAARGALAGAAVVEPSAVLAEVCAHVARGPNSLRVVKSQGQVNNEFAIPAEAFQLPGAAQPPASVVLACDRLADDLLGEQLVASLCAARAAAFSRLPRATTVRCVPSRAALVCAPLELRFSEAAGWDTSRANALRFSAHHTPEEKTPGARSWRCPECSWRNAMEHKLCEACRLGRRSAAPAPAGPPARASRGWWPADLDAEAARADVCRLCADEQVVCSFDFDDPEALARQARQTSRTLELRARRDCRLNAVAVWWRLDGPGGASVSSAPGIAAAPGAAWAAKRQAVHYLGFEIGLREGEPVTLQAEVLDSLTRIRFDLVSPQLTERMGLVKFEVPVTDSETVVELRQKLDLTSNRLLAPIERAGLERRDKLLQFGPFEVPPGAFQSHLWEKLESRTRLHADRPLLGDKPIVCVFRRGTFEGTVRWPAPRLADGCRAPRLPASLDAAAARQRGVWVQATLLALEALAADRPRVLEIGCGAAPLLAMCAAARGARAWAVEADPQLRDLAVETVRDAGLEMVSEYRGYASYSFFGTPRRPEDPSVRVLPAQLSTALRPGAASPRLLDGQRAHLVVRPPGAGALGEDYLEAMWHAAECLLEPGGRLVPEALEVRAVPVGWLPLVGGEGAAPELHARLLARRPMQAAPSDLASLGALRGSPRALLRVGLAARPPVAPSADEVLVMESAGLLTGVAWWHAPPGRGENAEEDVVPPYAMVSFLARPQRVAAGDAVRVSVRFEDHELTVSALDVGSAGGS